MSRVRRAPTDEEVARTMQISLAAYQHMLGQHAGLEIGSLNETRSTEWEEEIEYVPTPVEDDPLFRCLAGGIKHCIASAIDELPDRERLVISLYYYSELNKKEIAAVMKLSPGRMSHLHASAILRLRSRLSESREVINQGHRVSYGQRRVWICVHAIPKSNTSLRNESAPSLKPRLRLPIDVLGRPGTGTEPEGGDAVQAPTGNTGPEMRPDRIAKLKEAIRRGEYRVPSSLVAQKILEKMRRE